MPRPEVTAHQRKETRSGWSGRNFTLWYSNFGKFQSARRKYRQCNRCQGMKKIRRRYSLLSFLWLSVAANLLCGGAGYNESHQDLLRLNPVGLSLKISVEKHSFFYASGFQSLLSTRTLRMRRKGLGWRSESMPCPEDPAHR